MNYKQIMDSLFDDEYIKKTEFSRLFDEACGSKDKCKTITLLIEKYNCDFECAKMIAEYFIDKIPFPSDLTPQEIAYINMKEAESRKKITCPYCTSTNVKKISGIAKVGGFAMFGVFSRKVRMQWHCNHCGSDF